MFPNKLMFYVMAAIQDRNLKNTMEFCSANILKGNLSSYSDPHITLIQFEINGNHPYSKIFKRESFKTQITEFYKYFFTRKNTEFVPDRFELMGNRRKHFVKKYKSTTTSGITPFRKAIYKYIDKLIGKSSMSYKSVNNQKYIVFSYHKMPLFVVKDFYYGINVWTPHISIVSDSDIEKYNPGLYKVYMQQPTDEYKIRLLYKYLKKKIGNGVNKLNMKFNINLTTTKLYISVR